MVGAQVSSNLLCVSELVRNMPIPKVERTWLMVVAHIAGSRHFAKKSSSLPGQLSQLAIEQASHVQKILLLSLSVLQCNLHDSAGIKRLSMCGVYSLFQV